MSADSKGQKRPRDPNKLAKSLVDMVTGEPEDRTGRQPERDEPRKRPTVPTVQKRRR
jgi:hypothetical protein